MTHKEFFNVLIGKPPAEIELEIEIRKREVEALPDFVMKQYCLDLVKENKLQDFLIMAAMQRITETETKLLRVEMALHHHTKNLEQKKKKVKKTTIFTRIKAMLGLVS
tara:strand:- start:371 stop:694 length:324 start_codon:yes stop_codon:yes gene_type:complete